MGERGDIDDEIQAQLCNDFAAIVERKYRYYCARHGEAATPEGLLRYCVAAGVIKPRTVAHYMVMELYPRALYRNANAQEAHMDISAETGISERTVRRMLNRPLRYSPEAKK
jgi:hypothetical protein